MNTFGNLFTLTSFGESHGRAIGGGGRRYACRYSFGYGVYTARVKQASSRAIVDCLLS